MTINLLSANPDDLKDLVPEMGYSLVSNQILRDGKPIGYMYREKPLDKEDSGWRFLSGDEDQDYLDDDTNSRFIGVNAMANLDPTIVPYMNLKVGAEFERTEAGWVKVTG